MQSICVFPGQEPNSQGVIYVSHGFPGSRTMPLGTNGVVLLTTRPDQAGYVGRPGALDVIYFWWV